MTGGGEDPGHNTTNLPWYKVLLFLSLWLTCGERCTQRNGERESEGTVSSSLTCLCSDPVLQCAAVQMMSSPPAACCSKCDARPLQREDGGRDKWEGRGRRQGRGAANQNCNNTVTTLTPSHSPVYSLVTVCGSRRGDSHTFRADCDMLF